ncbi:MAG: ribbon-helix-helix protein, CopG family [Eubacteriales bacterium]|nr:ribbon-helix-helix protein, CopG family [Eubacteriales bacterium]
MGDRVPFQTTLNPQLIRQLKVMAAEQGRNVNDILEEIITKYIEEQK